jgi:hypothetical protein
MSGIRFDGRFDPKLSNRQDEVLLSNHVLALAGDAHKQD